MEVPRPTDHAKRASSRSASPDKGPTEQHHTSQPPQVEKPRRRSSTNNGDETKSTSRPDPVADNTASTDLAPEVKANSTTQQDHDSDAETVVLPGKDGYSPSKTRKVRQEDKADVETSTNAGGERNGLSKPRHGDDKASKTSRSSPKPEQNQESKRGKAGSSGIGSVPTSPQRNGSLTQKEKTGHLDRHTHSSSDESARASSEPSVIKSQSSKARSGDRQPSQKRKVPRLDLDDEQSAHKSRRQRTGSIASDGSGAEVDDRRGAKATPSPPFKRRILKGGPMSYGWRDTDANKGRRRRAENDDDDSDHSSASGSPQPRTHKLRRLALPTQHSTEINTSPAKVGPHKKHLDAHGQTLLARACARGEFEGAKTRLRERPEDLNVADYAGNTPLQIAALHGSEDIVGLLIDAGCNLDCVNYDKETPLLDAVDNGHLGVVKLLLDAGVNPRKANVNGEEPIDRVTDETDNAGDIRAALIKAKRRAGERRRTSEERGGQTDQEARDSNAPESPRRSPTAAFFGSSSRRAGTVRSTKTRNDLLYMPLDDKTLRQAAGRGDEETVARILQVKDSFNDPESMVAAARGGHDLVIQLLLGLGGANPDPAPVSGLTAEFATPVLAAIGQENIKVLELLLEQQGFDPTRKFKGETYHEIARRRQGTNWKEEEHLLKNAFDAAKRGSRHEGSRKTTKSPIRKEESRARREQQDSGKPRKRAQSNTSPATETRKKLASSRIASPNQERRADSISAHTEERAHKKALHRSKRDEKPNSDRELSPNVGHKHPNPKRTDSDAAVASSDGEGSKPRRKLISKGELRGERGKIRTSSITSNNSSVKDGASAHPRTDDLKKAADKQRDVTKKMKRDKSKDRAANVDESSGKRQRTSPTSDAATQGTDADAELPLKKRRIARAKEQRPIVTPRSPSPDRRPRKLSSTGDGSHKQSKATLHTSKTEPSRSERPDSIAVPSVGVEKSAVHVKSEDTDVDVEMPDLPAADSKPPKSVSDAGKAIETRNRSSQSPNQLDKQSRTQDKTTTAEQEAERKRAQEAEEAAAAEAAHREAREKEAEERAQAAEEERRKQIAEAERLEAERKRRAQEAEAEAERKRLEEERLEKERLEREAAEKAQRIKEEEERKERELRERLHREELERKRAAREAEARRIREMEERARLDKLPPLLRWLDRCPNPKVPAIAIKFNRMQGVRYDTINPRANHTAEGREQWLLNTDVALLLGEKDLDLSMYTAWERVPTSELAKRTLWRTEWPRYTLDSESLWGLGKQLDGYYHGQDPASLDFSTRQALKRGAWERFKDTSMFFVKLSDLLYTVPNVPHLRNIKLAVEYRELAEATTAGVGGGAVGAAAGLGLTQKWKQDPNVDRYLGFAPRNRYYVNGEFVGEDLPSMVQTSKTPFPDRRVPRKGLTQVFPSDPDYTRLCMEQGLSHLVKGSSPGSASSQEGHSGAPEMTGLQSPVSGANGLPSDSGRLLNGVHHDTNT